MSSDRLNDATAFVDLYLDEIRDLDVRAVPGPCLTWGRGGVGYALYRSAMLRGDVALLERAGDWLRAATRQASTFRLRNWTKTSYSRGLTGLYAIAARISHARGDRAGRRRALDRFLSWNGRARGSIELYEGAAGRLAGMSALLRDVPAVEIRLAGEVLARRLADRLDARRDELSPRGIAHGWPGVLLGLLAWERVSPTIDDARLRRIVRRFHPYRAQGPGFAHGHAGMALVFARAFARLGDAPMRRWARQAATRAIETMPDHHHNIVWGATGVACAVRAVAEIDPGGGWHRRVDTMLARTIRALEPPPRDPLGLWAGMTGLYCVALDVVHDDHAGFPGVES